MLKRFLIDVLPVVDFEVLGSGKFSVYGNLLDGLL